MLGGLDHAGQIGLVPQMGDVDPRRISWAGRTQPDGAPGLDRKEAGDEAEPATVRPVAERPGREQVQVGWPVRVGAGRPQREHHLEARSPVAGRGRQVDRDQRMVGEIAPDAGQAGGHRDAQLAQFSRGANTRTQQDGRAAVRAGREHHRAGRDRLAVAEPDAPHRGPVQLDPVNHRARPDRQAGPAAGRGQVGQRGAHPQATTHVAGHRPDAGDPRPVVVIGPRMTSGDRRRSESLLQRGQLAGGGPADRHRPVAAVPVAAKVGVGLDGPENWQQLRERPARIAQGRPPVIVGRPATHREPRVSGRAAADQPSPGQ